MTLLTFVETREAIGVAPVKDYMQSLIGDWPLLSANYNDSKFDWKQALPKMVAKVGLSPIFNIDLDVDANDTKVNRFNVSI